MLERGPPEPPHRLADRLPGRPDLELLDPVLGGAERLVVRLNRDLQRRKPVEKSPERFGLLAGPLEVLGEPARPVHRLLAGGERLTVDLQSERLAGPVHRREHFGGVPPEPPGLDELRPYLVEEAGDDADDRLLGDLAGLGQELRELRRARAGDLAEELLDLHEPPADIGPRAAERLEGRLERAHGALHPTPKLFADVGARPFDRGNGLVPLERGRPLVGREGRVERRVRRAEVAGREQDQLAGGPDEFPSLDRRGDLPADLAVELLERLVDLPLPDRGDRLAEPSVEGGHLFVRNPGPLGDGAGPLPELERKLGLGLTDDAEEARDPLDGDREFVGDRRRRELVDQRGSVGGERGVRLLERPGPLEDDRPALLEGRRDRPLDVRDEVAPRQLDRLPVGLPRQLAELGDPFGSLGEVDPDLLEELQPVLDLRRRLVGELAALFQRLRLLLQDPGQAGGRDAPQAPTRTGHG